MVKPLPDSEKEVRKLTPEESNRAFDDGVELGRRLMYGLTSAQLEQIRGAYMQAWESLKLELALGAHRTVWREKRWRYLAGVTSCLRDEISRLQYQAESSIYRYDGHLD